MKTNNWIDYSVAERKLMLQTTSETENIPDYAIEKDWWVSVVLKALFSIECSQFLLFKGGTSLSKGWQLIERFSEDIDIALNHRFFELPTSNNNQLKNLRKKCRLYVVETISKQLFEVLHKMGLADFQVEAQTKVDGEIVASDADPTIINVSYKSIADGQSEYVPTKVKIEISCLSMDVPFETKHITTLVSEVFPNADTTTDSYIRTVVPSRTFLEKAFLLCEEFQKETPRHIRMSRHLYDLEKLMDTSFARDALNDKTLYNKIVEHRRKFYHSGYVDYDKDYPQNISFVPPKVHMAEWESDYNNLIRSFVYGKHLTFEQLIQRIEQLQERFRMIAKG